MKHLKLLVALALLTTWVVALGFGASASSSSGIEQGKVRLNIAESDAQMTKAAPQRQATLQPAEENVRPSPKVNAVQSLTSGLSGTYNIPGDFSTIGAAVAVLNYAGVAGDVTFQLTGTSYLEVAPVVVGAYPGNDTYTVTMSPAAGVAATIQFGTTLTEGKGFAFNGAKNFVIDGINTGGASLTIKYAAGYTFPTNDPLAATLYFVNASKNITVKNCTLYGNIQGASFEAQTDGRPIAFLFRGASEGDYNDGISVDYNTVIWGTFGMKILCEDGNGDNYYQGGVSFSHNNIGGAFGGKILMPIFSEFALALNYSYNVVDGIEYNNTYWYYGPTEWDIDWVFAGAPRSFLYNFGQYSGGHIYYSGSSSIVANNYIKDVHALGNNGDGGILVYGLVVRLNLSGTGGPRVMNNRVTGLANDDQAGQIIGIRYTGDRIWHNTFVLTGPMSGTGIISMCASGDNNLKGNILANLMTGGTTNNRRVFASPAGASDFNNLYSTGVVTGSSTPTFADYLRAQSLDRGSVWGLPNLDGTLHMVSPSPGEDIVTTAIGVATDIDGDPRAAAPSDAGADEVAVSGALNAVDVLPVAIPAPVAGIPSGVPSVPTVTVKNNSNQSSGSFNVTLTTTSYSDTKPVTLGPGASSTISFAAWTPAGAGTYVFTATTGLADADPTNDAMTKSVAVSNPDPIVPKTYTFDGGMENWSAFTGKATSTNAVTDWLRSNSFTKLGGPYSGYSLVVRAPYDASTYTEGAYASSQGYSSTYPGANILMSPWLDLSAWAGTNTYISFVQSMSTEPLWDRSWWEYTTDGVTWNKLGVLDDPNGVNWYASSVYANAPFDIANFDTTTLEGLYGFTRPATGSWSSNGSSEPTGPNGYVFAQLKMTQPTYPTRSNHIRFRYFAWSDAATAFGGWAVDNIRLDSVGTVFTGGIISGNVFADANGNGVKDGGDGNEVGLTVSLSYFGIPKATTTTDGSGNYSFDIGAANSGLPGVYNVLVTKAGSAFTGTGVNIFTGVANVNHPGTGGTLVQDIGTYTSNVSGLVWKDDNKDGVLDGGEAGRFEGFEIQVHKDSCAGALLGTITSDANGVYAWPLPPGTYYFTEVEQENFLSTAPAGNCASATVSGASTVGPNFGNWQYSTVVISALHDLDGNAVKNAGDVTGLPLGVGARFTLVKSPADTLLVATLGYNTTVDATQEGLDFGTYTVYMDAYDNPSGWTQSNNLSGTYSFTIDASGQAIDAAFLFWIPPSISGTKFEDLNGNGVKDAGEPGLAGWTISTTGAMLGANSTVTDANGDWMIDSLGAGAHVVSEAAQTGWVQTFPVAGGGTWSYSAISGGYQASPTGKNFGNFKTICVSGVKYRDRNNNGTRDAGEEGLPNWQINITGTGAGSVLTDANGAYSICNIGPGSHVMTETSDPLYTLTEPAGGNYTFTAASGTDVTSQNFGNFLNADGANRYRTFTAAQLGATTQAKAVKRAKPGKPILMPNSANVIEEIIAQSGQVLVVGKAGQFTVGAKPVEKGYIQPKKQGDVYATLNKKGVGHTGTARALDFFNGFTKRILKKQTKLDYSKQDNKLIADAMALQVSLAASMTVPPKTPAGLGELIYNEAGNPLAGKTVAQIAAEIGDKMTNWEVVTPTEWVMYDSVIAKILDAFSTPMGGDGKFLADDTTSWLVGGKLLLKGVKVVYDVPFMMANPGAEPQTLAPQPTQLTPDEFELAQNYPNPFNPTTVIEFSLPEAATVTMKVYNLLGQEIATLFDRQSMDAGYQDVEFDASSLPSGVYLYRISAEGMNDEGGASGHVFTQVKKMVLVK